VDKEWWRQEKEVVEMLSLEAIGVLGILYALLAWGLVRAALARKRAASEEQVEKGVPVATG
jgi:hypothetical protein